MRDEDAKRFEQWNKMLHQRFRFKFLEEGIVESSLCDSNVHCGGESLLSRITMPDLENRFWAGGATVESGTGVRKLLQ